MKRDVMAGAEGSASDEAHAARGESAADAEPANQRVKCQVSLKLRSTGPLADTVTRDSDA